ncbi:restriction endonuclease subunit S [Staphylococcus epidermidis]|nr:restriction endonuclease subunit S [Staphylococcus epidermidis]MCG1325297.1 restriction endonuclease subunit S [Staphylococcus epidermidis]MCG1329667.1 restriction endonuclease subunit S [Staphylococcus epidermidis]
MTEQTNTPKLRFPNYEDLWISYKLNDISERVTRKNQNLESQRPLTISGQLGLIDQIEYFNKSVSSKNLTNYTLIKKGEFAYNKSYSNGYPLGAIKKLERYDLGILSSLYICFSFNENIDKNFMKNYFESTKWHREVANIAVEGARNHGLLNIPVNDFFNINIKLPIQYEQEKIGAFFSKLDHQIELEEKKLELLEQQKRGYMQKIFSQQLKFKDENGQYYTIWKAEKLGKLTDITTGSLDANAMVPNGKYKFFTCARETYEIDTYAFDTEALLISGNGANVGYIHYYQGKFNAYQRTYVLNNFKANITYLKYYLEKYLLKRIYSEKRDGNTPYITRSTLYDMEILIPSLEEQEKIGNFFNKIDNLIELQTDKIEVLKQRKKGLLQKMFV